MCVFRLRNTVQSNTFPPKNSKTAAIVTLLDFLSALIVQPYSSFIFGVIRREIKESKFASFEEKMCPPVGRKCIPVIPSRPCDLSPCCRRRPGPPATPARRAGPSARSWPGRTRPCRRSSPEDADGRGEGNEQLKRN